MQLLYYISQMKLTGALIDSQTLTSVPLLNETLRPHLDHPEDQEGDLVHADLEAANRLAKDILYDLGDKGIDVLAISVEDELYAELTAAGHIRDSERKDPFQGRMLKLSREACVAINRQCTVVVMPYRLPPNHVVSNMETMH